MPRFFKIKKSKFEENFSLMNISYNWLKDYIQFEESPQKLAEILTDLGLEIGGIQKKESVKGGLEGLVIGEVLTCDKHPDADKLKVTTVHIGNEAPLNIVCGAPNVAIGQKVVVATIGTVLYSGEESFKIKKSKIRGVLSEGMLCGEDEIGLGNSHEGIMELPLNIVAGTLAKNHFEVKTDYILEVDITPNRADALSHIGVARDLAAYFQIHGKGNAINHPVVPKFNQNTTPATPVKVVEPVACPKYCGIQISGVSVKPSPAWLQEKLKSIGLKPINNIVDITNFVLMEMGQSLHAFDAKKVAGGITVGKNCAGQKLLLLDETEIELTADDLVISSNGKPVCLAGVMGGKESGVTNQTTDLFLEAAYFNPIAIRTSSKRHHIKSDSSYRFERGLDPNNTELALQRAVDLILQVAGGYVASELSKTQSENFTDFEINFRYSQCAKVLGEDLGAEKITAILDALNISYEPINEDELALKVPQYRVDVQRECDVIEEILRIYGYNNIAIPTQINSSIVLDAPLPEDKFQTILSDTLTQNGFNEILCNSLTKPELYKDFDQFNEEQHIELMNPLSSDLSILRRSLLFGGLETIQRNQNMKSSDLKLYEIGKIYLKNEQGSYHEEKRLNLFLTGNKNAPHWDNPAKKTNFFTLKAYVNLLLEKIGAKSLKVKGSENPFFSDSIAVYQKKKLIVEYGEVKSSILKKAGIKQAVYVADFNWSVLLEIARNAKIKYTELSKFHPVKRDLSLLLDQTVSYKQIEALAYEAERNFLQQVELFDVYQGDKLPENKKSYALSFQLQSQEETLKDKQIDKVMDKLIATFQDKLGAKLR